MKYRLSFISFWKRILLPLAVIISLFFFFSELHSQPYLRYFENGKVGYIDTTGKIVIKAKFAQAGDFSEGLAPARLEGLYGFIDINGDYVIPPKYDYANSFKEGLAIVYVDSIPMYIDKTNNIPFETKFQKLYDFKRGIAKVKAYDCSYGLINNRGNVIVRGAKEITLIDSSGIYKVETLSDKLRSTVYVIDSTGKILVEPGKIKNIEPFSCGLAYVSYGPDTTKRGLNYFDKWEFVNTSFETVIRRKGNIQPMGEYSEGLIPILIIDDTINAVSIDNNFYCGFMDTSGNITIRDTSYKVCGSFENGKANVISGEQLFSINKQGKILKKFRSKELPRYEDKNGNQLIYKNNNYFIIDPEDNFRPGMVFESARLIPGFGDFVFMVSTLNENKKLKYGICNLNGEIILDPVVDMFSAGMPYNSLMRAIIDNRRCYVNNRGKIIWQEKEFFRFDTLDIDYINTVHHKALVGGKISDLRFTPPDKKLSIMVFDDDEYTYQEHPAKRIYLINNSKEKVRIKGWAEISGIFLCQALNPHGEWVNIEKFDSPDPLSEFIKDDYYLFPEYYYVSLHPSYKGGIKTKLRYMFYYLSNTKSEVSGLYEYKTVFSNEFYGSINPGQLWRNINQSIYKEDMVRDFFWGVGN